MKLAVVLETRSGERRVAASPNVVAKWTKAGWAVDVERSAGAAANFPDSQYEAAGATIVDRATAWSADIVVKVRPPETAEIAQLREGACLIGFVYPAQNEALVTALAERKVTVLAMDQVPRISRAQKMDALSSMANISGYRAVIEAANRFGSFFTGQFTAAGKVPPAKVLIIGAGVAGLSALGAAKGLGAIVRAFDVRAAAEEQIKSLGGEFLTVTLKESGEGQGGYAKEMSQAFIDAEYALFRAQAKDVDIVITTALIPGKPAPKLWLKDMVELMKPGSVVVDLAAEQGGNCEYTKPGEAVTEHGVTIIGYTDLPSRMAAVASDLYGMNLWHFLEEMGGAQGWKIDHDNDAVRPALVLEKGDKKWPAPPVAKKADAPAPAPKPAETPKPQPLTTGLPAPVKAHGPALSPPSRAQGVALSILGLVAAAVWLGLRYGQADAGEDLATFKLLQHVTVFVMAVFVGFQVVWNVTAALHTPLMSVTNAISGIIVVGGLLSGRGELHTPVIVAVVATFFASINIAGGFIVTRRMLAMFRK
ncbi:MAG TPA: Re/Si-specific NAD(P)(+) transhydrogenase subunit alpha [Kofleriaceae bacterium]|jgi:NAD(P) transhydrogenase subunit alpha|nr:Re/Si-specific NAD(P)(+) transhydrogenase subunit alpha [Kofleriaceae bacterium]